MRVWICLLVALLFAAAGTAQAESADVAAIQHVMRGTWEKPDAPLGIEPVVVVSDHAIAGWTQGDMGGRALLRRKDGMWQVVLCSGDGIKSADALKHAGIAAADAESLLKALADAERTLPAAKLAQFAKFEGILMMDASGAHPPHDAHAPHGAHK